ncbi:Protein O-mannosyltransferase 2 [Apophysomyces sp. BC1034]|nr:Protein O-mannosyltransferase 2 [Apophysomyces sp. BC1034]
MSSVFQARLLGNPLGDNPVDLAVGSNITLKNGGYGGALLHSHIQTYPEGSQQQQVTCYHHKDINNNWVVQLPVYEYNDNVETQDDIQLIKNGDVIRLMHLETGLYLRSHPIDAPVSVDQWEVSAHTNNSIQDQGDLWKIEVVASAKQQHTSQIQSLTTKFRLRHVELDCLLAADNTFLPQWGFRQLEVVCDKNNRTGDESTWWNVEEHVNEKLPPPPKDAYRSRFWTDFVSLNSVMWVSNNALIADPEKDDILTSEPTKWPMMSVGLRMCGWEDEMIKFYLLGSPAVWWPAFLSLWVFAASVLLQTVRLRRQIPCMSPGTFLGFH